MERALENLEMGIKVQEYQPPSRLVLRFQPKMNWVKFALSIVAMLFSGYWLVVLMDEGADLHWWLIFIPLFCLGLYFSFGKWLLQSFFDRLEIDAVKGVQVRTFQGLYTKTKTYPINRINFDASPGPLWGVIGEGEIEGFSLKNRGPQFCFLLELKEAKLLLREVPARKSGKIKEDLEVLNGKFAEFFVA